MLRDKLPNKSISNLDNSYYEPIYNLSFIHICMTNHFIEGWKNFESRWQNDALLQTTKIKNK